MGNLLRRVLAFVLGMVFSTVAGIGALLGGGYWAYKNVKPVAIMTDDENLGELRDQSVEELLGLVLSALEDPDQYTFARLEAEYGLDLQSMLEGLGVTDVDTNGKNWAALMGISLFNLSEGIEPMLDSIKVRALYNFIPALMDKELDQVLSREAQEKLGDYSIMELVKSDELTGEMGLLKALKTLKLGALLPEYFNAEYDQAKHEYTYTLNEENEQAASLPVLGLFGNVSLGVIQGMMNGNDIMTELLEGGLSTVAETPIEEILYAVVATFAPELSETVKERAKALNGATIADLFVPNAEGGYDFYYTGVLSSIEVGYLLGYTDEDGDGVWLDKEGNPVEDLMQVVSNINLGKVIEEEDTFKLIDGLIGDVSLGMILNICGIEEGKIPQLDAFRGIEVGKLLEGQEGEFNGEVFFKALMNTLSESFGDVTLGEMIGMEETGNVILDSLFELKLADLMLEEYTVENIVEAFRNALGDVSIGLIMGYEKDENGAWICDDEVLSLLLDFSFNNIFDVVSSDFTPSQIVEALLPDLCIGDLLCAFLDFERDEASSLYYYTAKTGRVTYLTEGASEFLDLKINDVVTALTDENAPEDMYAVLDAFKIGDAASITQAVVGKSLPITQENGKFVWGGDATSETSRVLNISAANVLADILNGGEKMLHKVDIDTYIDCVSKIAQEFANRTDLGKIFSAITIKNALEIAKECIDGPIANLTIDENYEIVEIIVRAAMIAVEVIYPAESRPEWVDTAAAIVDDHLDRGTFKDFPENFINKTPDGLINAIHAVVEDLLGEKYGDMVDAAADLLHRVIAGESLTQITIDTTQSIGALLADVEVIVDTFVSNEKVGDVVGALADLFANVTMDNFVEDILALNDELITAAADIVKAVFPEYAELADAVAQLLFDVAAGSLGAPGYENNLTVDVLFNDLQAVLGSVLDYEIIDKICDGMERIYEGVLVTDFIDATFNKGPELVYAVFALAEELFPEHEVLFDAIEKLVRDVTKGTISNPGIEADITVDVLVTDVHAILDYFLDVELLDKICRNIADMYEGVKVVDIVDATMNMGGELLTAAVKFIKYVLPEQAGLIEDIEKLVRDVFSGSVNNIVIGKDLTVDLLVDDIQQIINNFTDHELVGKICNNLEALYQGVLVENFVDATMNMGGELLTVAVKFVKYIVPEQAGLIEDVEKLVRDVFSGSINNIVIGKDLTVDLLVDDIQQVINNFTDHELVGKICNNLEALYEGVLVENFVDATLNMGGELLTVAVKFVKYVAPKYADAIDDVEKLIRDTIAGSLNNIHIDPELTVDLFLDDAQAVLVNFFDNEKVNFVIDQLEELFAGVSVVNFAQAALELQVKAVVDTLAEIVTELVPSASNQVAAVQTLINDILGGTLGELGYHGDTTVAKVLEDVDNVLVSFGVSNDVIDLALTEIGRLYEDSTLATFVEDTLNIEVDALVESVATIVKMAVPNVSNSLVNDVATLITDILGGTLGELGYHGDALVEDIIEDLTDVLKHFVEEQKVYDVIEIIDNLYFGVTLADVVDETLDMDIDEVIEASAEIALVFLPDYQQLANEVTALLTDVLDGSIGALIVDEQLTIGQLIGDVQDIVDDYVSNETVHTVIDALEKLFEEVRVFNAMNDILDVEFTLIAETVAKIVGAVVPDKATLATAIKNLIEDVFAGSIAQPEIAKEISASELIDDVQAIVNEFYQDQMVNDVINAVEKALNGVDVYTFGEDILNVETAQIVDALGDVGAALLPEMADLFQAVEGLINNVITGTVSTIAFNEQLTIGDLLENAQAITNALLEEENALINVCIEQLSNVFENVEVLNVVEGLLQIDTDDIIVAVEEILSEALDFDEQISNVANLLRYVTEGTIEGFGVAADATLGGAIDLAKYVLYDYLPEDDKLTAVIDTVSGLLDEAYLSDLVNGLLAIDVDELIDAVNNVTDIFEVEGLDELYNYLHVALNGSLKAIEFDFEALWNEIPQEAKNIILPVGVVVIAGVGTLLYFTANDTLVDIVTMILGEDATIGSLIAEALGYTAEESKYTFEGEENALASAVFNTKVAEILTTGFDFEGAYANLLTIQNVAEVLDAVATKYLTEIGDAYLAIDYALDGVGSLYGQALVKDIVTATDNVEVAKAVDVVTDIANVFINNDIAEAVVNELSTQVGVLYGTTTFGALKEATDALHINDIILSVSEVAKQAITSNRQKAAIDDLAVLLNNVFAGTVAQPGYVKELLLTDLITDAKTALWNIYQNDIVEVAINQVIGLYEGVYVDQTVEATKNLELDRVVVAAAQVVEYVAPEEYDDTVAAIAKLLCDAFGGAIIAPNYHSDAEIATLIDDVQAVINSLLAEEIAVLNTALNEIEVLYGETDVATFVDGTLAIELKKLVASVVTVVKTLGVLPTATMNVIEELGVNFVDGSIGNPAIDQELTVDELLKLAHAVVDCFVETNELVDEIFAQLEGLYSGKLVVEIENATKALEIDRIVNAVAAVVGKAVPAEWQDTVTATAVLVNEVLGGTIENFGYHNGAEIDVLIGQAQAIVNSILAEENDIVNEAFEQLATLYANATIESFVQSTLELKLDGLTGAVAAVATAIVPEEEEMIADIATLLTDALAGSIEKGGIESELTVKTLLTDVKEVVWNKYQNNVVEEAINQLQGLYAGQYVTAIVPATLDLDFDLVVNAATAVAQEAIGEEQAAYYALAADVAELAKDAFGGTLRNIQYNEAFTVDELLADVKEVVWNVYENAIVEEAIAQLSTLYKGDKLTAIADETMALTINQVVNAVAAVVSKAVPAEWQDTVTATAILINEVFGGSVGNPGYYTDAEIDVIINEVQAIVESIIGQNAVVTAAFNGVESLYSDATITSFVNSTLDIKIDDIIKVVAETVNVTGIVSSDAIAAVEALLVDTLDGSIQKPEVTVTGMTVDALLAEVKEILVAFGVNHDGVNGTIKAISDLYKDVEVINFVPASQDKYIDEYVNAVEAIAQAFLAEDLDDNATHVADLIEYVVAGKFATIGADPAANMGKALELAEIILLDYLPNQMAEDIIDEVAFLLKNVEFGDILTGLLAIDAQDLINTANNITDICGVEGLEELYDYLHTTFSGEIGNVQVDFEALWNKIPQEAKNVIVPVGAVLIAGVGTLLYFTANDTLVEIINTVLPDETIGSLLAEVLGYTAETVEEEVKYTFEGEENALASAVFATGLAQMLTTGFDFAGNYGELLTIDNLTEVIDAVTTKYLTEIGYAYGIIDATVDQLGVLYEDVHVKNIVKASQDLTVNEVITSVSTVAQAAITSDNYDALVAGLEVTANKALGGTMINPGYLTDAVVSELVDGVQAAVWNVYQNNVVGAAFDAVEVLYSGVKVKDFVPTSQDLPIDNVIGAVEKVVAEAISEEAEMVADCAQLLKDALVGTVVSFDLDPNLTIGTLLTDVQNVLWNKYENAIVAEAFDQLKGLYAGQYVTAIVPATLGLDFDLTVNAAVAVAQKAIGEQELYNSLVEDVAKLAKDAFVGELGNPPAVAGDFTVDLALADVKAIYNNFYQNGIVDTAVDQIADIYKGVQFPAIATKTTELKLAQVVSAVAAVVNEAVPAEWQDTVTATQSLVNRVFGGDLINPGYYTDAEIDLIINDAQAIVNSILEQPVAALDAALNGLEVAYENSTIATFLPDTLAMPVSGIASVVAETVNATGLVDGSLINDVEDLFLTVLDGSVQNAYVPVETTVDQTLEAVQAVLNNFEAVKNNNLVQTVFAQLINLYEDDDRLRLIANETLALGVDQTIAAVANVAKEAIQDDKLDVTVQQVADLAAYLLTGELVKPGFNNEADFGELVSSAKQIINNYYNENELLNVALDEVSGLLTGINFINFDDKEEGVLGLDTYKVIDAVAVIANVEADEKADEAIADAVELVKLVINDGNVVNVLNSINTAATVDQVLEGVQAVYNNYYQNNIVDTVVTSVANVFENIAIGALNDAENNPVFGIEISSIIDNVNAIAQEALKGTKYAATVDGVANLAKHVYGGTIGKNGYYPKTTVETLVTDVKAIVSSIAEVAAVNTVLDAVEQLFGDKTLEEVITKNLGLINELTYGDVIDVAAQVASEFMDDKATLITAAKELVDVVVIREKNVGATDFVNGESTVSEVLAEVNGVLEAVSFENAYVNAAIEVVDELFGTKTLSEVITKNIGLINELTYEQLVGVAARAVKAFASEYEAVIDEVEQLVKLVLIDDANVGAVPFIEGDVTVSEVLVEVNGVLAAVQFENAYVNAAIDVADELFGAKTLGEVITKNIGLIKELTYEQLVGVAAKAVKAFASDYAAVIDEVEQLVKLVLIDDANVGATPFIEGDVTVSEVLAEVNGVLAAVQFENAYATLAIEVVDELFGAKTLEEVITKKTALIKELTYGDVIDVAAQVASELMDDKATLITAAKELVDVVVIREKTVGATDFVNGEATVSEVLAEVNGVLEAVSFENAYVNAAIDVVDELFGAKTLGEAITKNIGLIKEITYEQLVGVAAKAVKAFASDYAAAIDEVEQLAKLVLKDDANVGAKDFVNTDVTVSEVLVEVEQILAAVSFENAYVNAAIDVVDELFGAKTLGEVIAKKTALLYEITYEQLVGVAAKAGKAFLSGYETAIEKVEQLAKLVLKDDAKVLSKDFVDTDATLNQLIDATYAVASSLTTLPDIAGYAVEQIKTVTATFDLGDLIADKHLIYKKFDINLTVTALANVAKQAAGSYSAIIEKAEGLVNVLVTGTFGDPDINFNAFWNALGKKEKVIVLGAGAVVGGAMYFVANDKLVELATKVVGNKTWYELIGSKLGYTLNGEQYQLNGKTNSLMNELLGEQVVATIGTDVNGLLAKYGDHVTLGNLLTAYAPITEKVEAVIPGDAKFEKAVGENAYTDWAINDSLGAVFEIILNVSLKDVLDHKDGLAGYALDLIADLTFADLGAAAVVNKLGSIQALNQLGLNMSATKTDGEWKFEGDFSNIFNALFTITDGEVLAAVQNGTIKSLFGDVLDQITIGDFIGEAIHIANNMMDLPITAEMNGEGKWISEGKFAIVLNALMGESITDVMQGVKGGAQQYIGNLIGDVMVGELLNNTYNEATGEWTNEAGSTVQFDGLMGTVKQIAFGLTIGDIINRNFDINSMLGGIYLGNLLGYECTTDHDSHDKNCTWEDAEGNQASGLVKALLHVSIADITGGGFNAILEDMMETLTLRDVLGSDVDSNSVLKLLADKPIGELTSSLDSLYVGDLLGYECNNSADHEHSDACVWEDEHGVPAEGVIKVMLSLTLEDLTSGDLSETLDGLTLRDVLGDDVDNNPVLKLIADKEIGELESSLNGMYIGELLGYECTDPSEHNHDGNCTWEDEHGNAPEGVIKVMLDLTIGDLTSGNFGDTLTSKINDLKLGDVITIDGGSHIVLQKLANVKVGELSTSVDDIVNDLKLGEVITINGSSHIVLQKLADVKIGELSTEMNTIVDELTLREVLGDAVDDNAVLALLADEPIGQLTTALNDMYVGEIMGYTYDNVAAKWYKDANDNDAYDLGEEVSGVLKVMVDFKVSDLGGNTFGTQLTNKINTLTLGEVITIDGGSHIVLQKLANVQIGNLATSMNDIVNDLTLGEVITIDGGSHVVLQKLANVKIGDLATSMNDIINDLTLGEVITIDGGSHIVLQKLENVKIGDLATSMNDIINDLTLGEVITINGSSHVVLQKLANVKIGNLATEMNGVINNLTLGEVITINGSSHVVLQKLANVKIGDLATEMNGVINNLTLGEVITINGSSHIVLQKLANVKIGELSTEMEGIINNLTLKEVLGESTVNSNAVLKLIANEPISGLSTAINGLYIGQILGYTDLDANPNDAVHDWDKAGDAPSGVLSVMVDFTIADMSGGNFANDLQTKIQGLKISDVINIDPSNTILSLIADSSIADLSDTINGLYVGEIMGYTPVYTGTPETLTGWKKGGVAVTGIGAIIADYTIASFSNANFASTLITDIKNELKISEFMPAGANPIFNLFDNYEELTVVEFEAQMQTRFTAANFTLGDMVTLGIIDQTTVTNNTLFFTAIMVDYNTSHDPDIDNINKLPIKVVFDELFDLIPAIP